jgi:hypothetical protein
MAITNYDRVDVSRADGVRVAKKVVPTRIPIGINQITAPATAVFFIADRAYKVADLREVHAALGTDAGTVTINVTKDTGTQAPGAGTTVMNGTFNAKAAINTPQVAVLAALAATLTLAAGDRLSIKYTGVLTALAGVSLSGQLELV